ncbi:acyloxyacyl hydrolase [Halofilum ochraceum]|uniref:acyloxyacyl hydrolase n=1 Tax=Halofilum ochraceum TaxID=1611323 RepID=UPI000831D49C|nr:acyloxyacyl hydrolase [Halofilum ochraceum]
MHTAIKFTLATLLMLLVFSSLTPRPAHADGAGGANEREIGIRTAAGDGVNTAEFYARWEARFIQEHVLDPWLPEGGTARWETALSYWQGGGDHAIVFAVGPTLEYPLRADGWRLALGIQPTLFSDYESDNRNLGGPFEFTSHIGLRWYPKVDWVVGARVQHTSNAGIYDANPGVDLIAVEIGSRF